MALTLEKVIVFPGKVGRGQSPPPAPTVSSARPARTVLATRNVEKTQPGGKPSCRKEAHRA
jgi:hypothetical protein